MKILAFANKDSGVSLHRIINPLISMPDVDVFVTNHVLEQHFEGIDILMYNRTLPDHHAPKIRELQEKHGFKIVVDIDDHWDLDEDHILYPEYQEIDFAKLQIRHITEADAVFTTHSRLAEEIQQYNENVHVLPNAIPQAGQFLLIREPHQFVNVFWQGSATHQKDIRLLRNALESLGPLSPKMNMMMAGFVNGTEEWYDMAKVYTANFKHQYSLIPPAPVDDYYKIYAQADICLVPLVESRFNRMKSNLKVLEAGNMGIPVIASEVHPYLGLPVRYARHSGEWASHIKRLVNHKRERRDEGAKLKEYCNRFFNFNKINKERKEILEYIATKQYEARK